MKRKMTTFVSVLVSAFLIAGMATGCTALKKQGGTAQNGSGDQTQSTTAQEEVVFKSVDGKVQITAGNDWKADDQLNTEAQLQISNRVGEKYAIVLSETKENFSEDMTLDDYYKIISDNMKQSITNSTFQGPFDVTVNGSPAKQFELHGEVEKIKAAYIVTVVGTSTGFHQIVAWTLESRFTEIKDELVKVSGSFKEITP